MPKPGDQKLAGQSRDSGDAMNQDLLYGMVLLSAAGHAVWNALLKNATDRLIMMVAIRIVGVLYGLIVL